MSCAEAFDLVARTLPDYLTVQKNEIARAILKEIRERRSRILKQRSGWNN